ncbi:MAG: rhomboid family intramembrane serine protease [Bauldia sp.]|nr:rhomboid family intramembrane serine protease [Bauldia sp.]
MTSRGPDQPARQRALNIPVVIFVLVGLFVAIEIAMDRLSLRDQAWAIVNFAFIPNRDGLVLPPTIEVLPGAAIWSVITYAFLHGGWAHLAVNSITLVSFGSPLAWRFGTLRFLVFSAAAAAAGAGAHYLGASGDATWMVGASAAISGHMAASARFMFLRPVPALGYFGPAAPLSRVLTDRRTLTFLIAWFGVNIVVGLSGMGGPAGEANIAWQSHIGGFVAGLVLFPLLDPVGRRLRPAPPDPGTEDPRPRP